MADPKGADNAALQRRPGGGNRMSDAAAGIAKDVWSRSGSKYHLRAVVLLMVNVLLFAGVGSFTFWLRSGVRFAPIHEGYWDELKQSFWSIPFFDQNHSAISLGSLLLEPINVQDVPMQIPILGLLMAALISIPIVVSILYRFWSSLPLLAVVAFLALMPWLAVALLFSCILASGRTFRTRFRFVSALAGLLPAVVYLLLAWYGTTDLVAGRIDPLDRVKFYAPWVLAIVASAAVFAIVLAIAKLVDYRPGAVTPLLAIMFGLPVALFEFHVGRDELYYRLLEALKEAHFADVDASVDLNRAVMETWSRRPPSRRSMEAVREVVETRWLLELAGDIEMGSSSLAQHQAEVVDRCDWFRKYFPQSRYVPSVLFIKAQALDMRVDPGEFRRTKWIRFYDDFPGPTSFDTWRVIAENRPESVLGAVACLRLAQLDARNRDVERAINRLSRALARFDLRDPGEERATVANGSFKGMLTPESPEASLAIPLERVLLEAQSLHDLLTLNRDPLYDYEPISGSPFPKEYLAFGLLDLDPRHENYLQNLQDLKMRYPNCQIEDNIDLEIAKATPARALSIERLESCLQRFPDRDAVPEALFRLGVAYNADGKEAQGGRVFDRLAQQFPRSVWSRQALAYTPWRGASSGEAATAQADPPR